MYAKLLSLFTFAAIAIAQTDQGPTFPNGYFYINSVANDTLRIDVKDSSTAADAQLVLTQARSARTGEDKSQIWSYNNQTGKLTNFNTNNASIVFTAVTDPATGDIIEGHPLIQAVEVKGDDNLNQTWIYESDQRIVSLKDESMCVVKQDDIIVMSNCTANAKIPEQKWSFSTGGRQ
ncbi:hypothetical protein AN958_05890 [Leucoagaricus sp. SymC.cos]|nr:hypothetical protein AN958_05890 [Leucoagaricus sp. SymC.cos]